MKIPLPTIEGVTTDELREAIAAAEQASGHGEWMVKGAQGGTKAMLGRVLIAAVEDLVTMAAKFPSR